MTNVMPDLGTQTTWRVQRTASAIARGISASQASMTHGQASSRWAKPNATCRATMRSWTSWGSEELVTMSSHTHVHTEAHARAV